MFKLLKLLIQKILVAKGSNFVYCEEYFPIFQTLVSWVYVNYQFFNVTSICPKHYLLNTIKLSRAKKSCKEI